MESAMELLFLGIASQRIFIANASGIPVAPVDVSLRTDGPQPPGRCIFSCPWLLLFWSRTRRKAPPWPCDRSSGGARNHDAAYLVYNRITVGVFMPTSGATKAGLSMAENMRDTLLFSFQGDGHNRQARNTPKLL